MELREKHPHCIPRAYHGAWLRASVYLCHTKGQMNADTMIPALERDEASHRRS